MNPHAPAPTSPAALVDSLIKHRSLILQMVRRDILGRYRGSSMGLAWSFFNPLMMLAVYTFVFSVVFKARWAGGSESKTEFALILFAGLMIFNFFAECINKAPTLILHNSNYVKKVVFPLEILPVISLGAALFHWVISVLVWLVFYLVFFGLPHPGLLWLPVIMLPLAILTLGMSWFLAALGVYLRDVAQVVGLATTLLLFMSPIFYPISALPALYQKIMLLNPLTLIVEQARAAMLWGTMPNWPALGLYLLAASLLAWLSFFLFQKARKGFADVL